MSPDLNHYGGIRHEDALRLSFGDESVDILVSNDVFEHVPDIEEAMIEAYRIPSKSGKLLFSIPFHQKKATPNNGPMLTIMEI